MANEEIKEQASDDLLDSLKGFLEKLVPPKTVLISDIFASEYELKCSVSARKQIKILREFEKIDTMEGISFSDDDTMVNSIIKIASNEDYLEILCRCFTLGHPEVLKSAKDKAKEQDYEYEESSMAPADLFAIEELATAVVPFFIRLAKRASQAMEKILAQ